MGSNSRPLLTYTTLIVIVMISLGILLAQLTRSYFTNIMEDRIKVESQYFATYLESYMENNDISKEELYRISEQFNMGMVLISENGEVIMDTVQVIPSISKNEKQEILDQILAQKVSAQKGLLVEDIFSYTLLVDFEEMDGKLVLITPMKALSNMTGNIWMLIGFTLLLGLIVLFTIGFNIFSKYIRPIKSASRVAQELTEGNYNARTYEGHFGEAGQLNRSLNILARNLKDMTSTKGMQETQLEAVINNMGNGLVLIDKKGYILLVNRAFIDSFGGTYKDYISYLYHEAIPYTTVQETVQKIYMFEETVSESFVLPLNIHQKHLHVTGAPIFSKGENWKGVVLVFHDITELKRLEQMRKDFVANVSHELKTPITSIRGFSETLLDGAMKDEAMLEQFLRIILKESGRLQSLIADLLELSKLEKEGFQLNIAKVDVQQLLTDLLPIIKQSSSHKNILLKTEVNGQTIIQGDSSRMKQVFMNLLTNAVNYTAEGGKITVLVEELDKHVRISIMDSGIGIPEEEISRVFERFYRVDKARSRDSGGTGLGLAIVKHIVEAHGGTIEVESVVGEGTTFILNIPKNFTKHYLNNTNRV